MVACGSVINDGADPALPDVIIRFIDECIIRHGALHLVGPGWDEGLSQCFPVVSTWQWVWSWSMILSSSSSCACFCEWQHLCLGTSSRVKWEKVRGDPLGLTVCASSPDLVGAPAQTNVLGRCRLCSSGCGHGKDSVLRKSLPAGGGAACSSVETESGRTFGKINRLSRLGSGGGHWGPHRTWSAWLP